MKKSVAAAGGKIAGILAACFLLVVLTHLAAASALETKSEREIYRALKELVPARGFGAREAVSGAASIPGFYRVIGRPGEEQSAVLLVEAEGYRGKLSLLVHCKVNGEILAARLLPSREYPGMGKEAEKRTYMRKFIGTGGTKPVPLSLRELPPREAATVSGASRTFSGIARALESASAFVKNGGIRK